MSKTKKINQIPFMGIIKKAWNITWQNKFLWWFGLFISFVSFNSSFNWQENGEFSQETLTFLEKNLNLTIALSILVLIVVVVLIILALISRGGMIFAIWKIDSNKKTDFKTSFQEGKKNLGKIFGLNFVISVSLFIIILLVLLPVIYCFVSQKIISGIILSIPAFLIIVSTIVLASYLKTFGQIYIVSGKLKILASLENAYKIFKENLWSSLLMGIIMIPVAMVFYAVSVGILILLALLFLPIGILLWFLLNESGIVVTLVLALPLVLLIMLFLSSLFQTFKQAIWFLFFKEIAKKKTSEKVLEKINEKEKIVISKPKPTGGITQSKVD